MKRHPLILSLALAVAVTALFAACREDNVIYSDTHTFKNNTWMRFEPEVFNVDVNDSNECYDIYMSARLDTTVFKDGDLPLIINIYNESGERRMFNGHIQVRDSENRLLGKTIGPFVDVSAKVTKYFYFNRAGVHRFEIKNNSSKYEMPGVANFGLRLEKTTIEYPD